MSCLKVGFITTVSGRWPRELPVQRNQEYGCWLKEHAGDAEIVAFDHIVDSPAGIDEAVAAFRAADVDVVIMLYGAFTGDDVSTNIAERLKLPLILWAPREPDVHGGRLLSNALVAMTMNSASLQRLGHHPQTIYGGLESEEAKGRILSYIKAYAAVKKLRGGTLGLFGYRPTAFYNSAFDEGLIRKTFGLTIEETDLKVVFDRMQEVDREALDKDLAYVRNTFPFGDDFIGEYQKNHSRLYLTLKQLMEEQNYAYGVIKCWPEMGNLNAVPCAVLGRLADDGYSIACEGDVDVALAMAAQCALTGKANFITDLIDINEEGNYLTFWHCGNAAPSLHGKGCGATLQAVPHRRRRRPHRHVHARLYGQRGGGTPCPQRHRRHHAGGRGPSLQRGLGGYRGRYGGRGPDSGGGGHQNLRPSRTRTRNKHRLMATVPP